MFKSIKIGFYIPIAEFKLVEGACYSSLNSSGKLELSANFLGEGTGVSR